MFDSVLGHGTVPKSRFGTGAVVSVALHVALLGMAVYLSTRPARSQEKEISVVLKVAPPPPPPPPPPAAHKEQHKTPKKNQLVQPKEIPTEKPPEAEPSKEDDSGGVEGGVEGGVKGGVVGGVLGGTLGGTGTGTVPFGEGMTRPVLISGPGDTRSPQYTSEARAAEVEGTMLVKCTITVEGRLNNCQIIKPVPHMETAVLQWLAGAKYSPVIYQGRPQQVSYTLMFTFKLDR
jgi:periplasmic protein TonB